MYHYMGYSIDRDDYDELTVFDDVRTADEHIEVYQKMLCNDELKDKTGKPYAFLEVWNDADSHGVDTIIITR